MYIIAIGWLWVAFMMAITEPGVVAALLTFFFYGLLPCSLVMYLLGTPGRRRRQKKSTESRSAEEKQPSMAGPSTTKPPAE